MNSDFSTSPPPPLPFSPCSFYRLVGHFLTFSNEYCFVLCDGEDIVGYALAAWNAKTFYKQVEIAWKEEMKNKYPKPAKSKNATTAEVCSHNPWLYATV